MTANVSPIARFTFLPSNPRLNRAFLSMQLKARILMALLVANIRRQQRGSLQWQPNSRVGPVLSYRDTTIPFTIPLDEGIIPSLDETYVFHATVTVMQGIGEQTSEEICMPFALSSSTITIHLTGGIFRLS